MTVASIVSSNLAQNKICILHIMYLVMNMPEKSIKAIDTRGMNQSHNVMFSIFKKRFLIYNEN